MIVYDYRGSALRLIQPPENRGGEGEIYKVLGRPELCAKIYRGRGPSRETAEKIIAMIKSPPVNTLDQAGKNASLTWPVSPLYSDSALGRFSGYIMPYIEKHRFRESHCFYSPGDRISLYGGDFTWLHMLKTCGQIARTVMAVHSAGHCIGDFRESNLLVSPDAWATFIDCDSFQIRDGSCSRIFPCRVGTPDYSPPEFYGINFRETNTDRFPGDLFAMGVMMFQFLFMGVHPFSCRGRLIETLESGNIMEKIKAGLYPYAGRPGIEPPPFAPPYEVLPASLRKLFERCFISGHGAPGKRPRADEWYHALNVEIKKVKRCTVNRNHFFSADLDRCIWCDIKEKRNGDLFPSQGASKGRPGTTRGGNPGLKAHVRQHPAPRVRFCPECGTNIDKGHLFCGRCGLSVSAMN